jgi:legumain
MAGTGRKILRSGANSKVFMYIANHGATGLLAFPNEEFLFADEFIKALKLMKEKGLYEELLIYLDGSEAGSMFEGILPHDLNVLAVTASNPKETAFAAHCFPNDIVQGKNLGICMSDSFSLNWMRDTESHCPLKETLSMQLKNVKNATSMTTVTPYGDMTILKEKVGEFIGVVEPSEHDALPQNLLLDILLE